MNIRQPLAVISLIALTTAFAMPSFAKDVESDLAKKDVAEKDKGQDVPKHLPGCALTVKNPNVSLYFDRSSQQIPVAKLPPGQYAPVDYRPGWFKVRAAGWIAWMKDDPTPLAISAPKPQRNIDSKSGNCPELKHPGKDKD